MTKAKKIDSAQIKEKNVEPKKTVDPQKAAEYNVKVGFWCSIIPLAFYVVRYFIDGISEGFDMYSNIGFIIDVIIVGIFCLCISKKSKLASIGMIIYMILSAIINIQVKGITSIWSIIFIIGLVKCVQGCDYLQKNNLVKKETWVNVLSIISIVLLSLIIILYVFSYIG